MLGIIPAKTNSKRLIGKNVKLFCGKPLIWHTIKQAIKSKKIKKLIKNSLKLLKIFNTIREEVLLLLPE